MTTASLVDRLFALHSAGLPLPPVAGGAEGDPPPPKEEKGGPDLVKAIEGLIARNGGADGALRVLLAENHDHREKIRQLTESQPPAGAVVLKGDDAKAWEAYVSLGKPGDLRKALDDGKLVAAEATTLRKAEVVREAAELSGFKPGVLKTLAKDIEITFVEVKGQDGKAVREAHVKGVDDATTPLKAFAETEWKEFLPALKAEAKGFAPGTPPRRNGVPVPPVTSPETRKVKAMF